MIGGALDDACFIMAVFVRRRVVLFMDVCVSTMQLKCSISNLCDKESGLWHRVDVVFLEIKKKKKCVCLWVMA